MTCGIFSLAPNMPGLFYFNLHIPSAGSREGRELWCGRVGGCPGQIPTQLWGTGVGMPKVPGAPGCPALLPPLPLGIPVPTASLVSTGPNPPKRQDMPAPQTPCSCIVPLNGGCLYPFPDPVQSRRSWRKQSSAVFCLLLEPASVSGQVNCTLNSPDSSGGVS